MNAFKLEIDGKGIATLMLDLQPHKVNVLTTEVMTELEAMIGQVEKKPGVVFLVIKSGKPGSFIAGADIAEIKGITDEKDAAGKSRTGQELFDRISALRFPTLAVIDGPCLGGGLELALACTYRIASTSSRTKLGFPEVSLGIIPGFGGTQRMPRLTGLVNAISAITSGRQFDWRKSLAMHLVDEAYPAEFLDYKAIEFVNDVLYAGKSLEVARSRKKRKISHSLMESTAIGRALLFAGARKKLLSVTRGNYPAPLAALRVLRKTRSVNPAKGLHVERTEFARLAVSGVSKNLIRVYYGNEELRKSPQTEGTPSEIRSCGVVGAGVMGGAIAWLMSNADLPVRLLDIDWEYVRRGFKLARNNYDRLIELGKIDSRTADSRMRKISGATDYSRLWSADIVIEAIVEKIEHKRKALALVEDSVSADAVIATNTSSLSVTAMQDSLYKPERFCGMHFFNPVNRMQLVEVIPGEKTSPDTVATVVSFARALGKTPIVVKDSPGFLVNRILMAYLNEAILMLCEGFDVRFTDSALSGFGMPMGPFALLDEIGMDIAADVGGIIGEAFKERFVRTELLSRMKDAKLLGKKTGSGFYVHEGKKKKVNPAAADILRSVSVPVRKPAMDAKTAVDRCVYVMLNEAAHCLDEGVALRPEHVDMAMILGTGFPPFRGGLLRFAEETGFESVAATLGRLAEKYGKRFEPARYLAANKNGIHGHAA